MNCLLVSGHFGCVLFVVILMGQKDDLLPRLRGRGSPVKGKAWGVIHAWKGGCKQRWSYTAGGHKQQVVIPYHGRPKQELLYVVKEIIIIIYFPLMRISILDGLSFYWKRNV